MSSRLRATFLSGERIYIRALALEDKDYAAAWFRGPYPVNAAKAEEFLRDEHKSIEPQEQHLAIVRVDGDAIVGGVQLWTDRRLAFMTFKMAASIRDADECQAAALRLLVPWLRDEAELMMIDVPIAADEPLTIAAAEALGMERTATLRQWLARPGGRVDQHHYEALNPAWRVEERRNA
jgi:RimJ/RimL family protein N-acetyltransferase